MAGIQLSLTLRGSQRQRLPSPSRSVSLVGWRHFRSVSGTWADEGNSGDFMAEGNKRIMEKHTQAFRVSTQKRHGSFLLTFHCPEHAAWLSTSCSQKPSLIPFYFIQTGLGTLFDVSESTHTSFTRVLKRQAHSVLSDSATRWTTAD